MDAALFLRLVVAVESLAASAATIAASLAVPVKTREKAAPKPAAKITFYTVDPTVFGDRTVRQVLIDLDAAPAPLNAVDFEMACCALAVVRHTAQSKEAARRAKEAGEPAPAATQPTYRASECSSLRALLVAHKPTVIGRALVNAATDQWWFNKSLTWPVTVTHIASWLLLVPSKPAPKKANIQAEATRLLGLLRAKAPIVANDIDAVDTGYMNETAMAEHLERIRGECRKRSIPLEAT